MNLSITQALAFGLPVIATMHSGFPDQVENGVNGFLVPEGNPEALAERLLYLIEHPNVWEQFGKAGRRKAELQYDAQVLIGQQISLYEEVLSVPSRLNTSK